MYIVKEKLTKFLVSDKIYL